MPRRDVMPAPITVNWRNVEWDACRRKKQLGERAARAAAADKNKRGRAPRSYAYPCPFCHHWHLGRVPNMRTLRKVASALRARANDLTPL